MPDNNNFPNSEFRKAWLDFVESVRRLLGPNNERALDQYLQFRDYVIELVKDEKQFLPQLTDAFDNGLSDFPQIKKALLSELTSFSNASEVSQAEEKSGDDKGSSRSKWLERGSTVIGSIKDILCDVKKDIPVVKYSLTVFQELVDLFK